MTWRDREGREQLDVWARIISISERAPGTVTAAAQITERHFSEEETQ